MLMLVTKAGGQQGSSKHCNGVEREDWGREMDVR